MSSSPDNALQEGLISYKVYSSRWAILALFCFLSLANALMWVTFAPISDIANEYFGDIGITAINMLAVVFQILYGPGTYLGLVAMKHYGLKGTLLFGGFLTLFGALLRILGAYIMSQSSPIVAYIVVLLGQCCAALAQPMFNNLPANIAATWFASSERDVATTISSLFNPLGNAVGQVLPPMFVTTSSNSKDSGMATLLIVEAVIIASATGLVLAFFQSAPPTPPSHSAKLKRDGAGIDIEQTHGTANGGSTLAAADTISTTHNEKLKEEFLQLLTNSDYIILLLAFSVGLGLFNTFLTLINQLVAPHGYSNDDAGLLGAVLIVSGLGGAGVTGHILEKTRLYRFVLKWGFRATTLALVLLMAMLYSHNMTLLALSFGITGFCMLPMLPAVLENCAETTYPLPEELSTGLLFVGGNYLGIPFIFITEYLLRVEAFGPPPFLPSNAFLLGMVVVANIVLYFYHGEYHRHNMETAAAAPRDVTDSLLAKVTASDVGIDENSNTSCTTENLLPPRRFV